LLRALLVFAVLASSAGAEPRARDLGIPFEFGTPGKSNAITDVAGVEVGHVTLIEGDSVRTGVTAILPRGRGKAGLTKCFGGFDVLNGAGDVTGTHWLDESGLLEGPILLTDTNNVGVVRDSVIAYAAEHFGPIGSESHPEEAWSMPVVAETWAGDLNPTYAQPVRKEHVFRVIDSATAGPVAEGSVGGGTGMRSYGLKSGIGTSSRILSAANGGYTVGVLVQSNSHGDGLRLLRIAGVPVGEELAAGASAPAAKDGSIIVVVATDAPLLPHQLKRLARRATLGLARTGSTGYDTSGDMFIAFSTANPNAGQETGVLEVKALPNARINPLFEAVAGATEESIVNALVAARTMTGARGSRFEGLPLERVRAILRRHDRLTE